MGYNRIIIAVKSLEDMAQRTNAAGCALTALPVGDGSGQPAHAVMKDPDGILLELVEAPGMVPGEHPARIIALGITANDLATTVEDMCDGFGFSPCKDLFYHGTFWPEDGRLEQSQTLQLGDMYLVVSQYRDSHPRSADYQLCDIGVMNFAVSFPDQADFEACYGVTRQMGMKSNSEPLIVPHEAAVTYNNDRQGFSVEMIFMARKLWGLYGFAHPRLKDRIVTKFLEWKSRRDYRKYIARTGN